MTLQKISICMPKDFLLDIEACRGKTPRSRYIRQKLEQAMKEEK